MLATMSSFMLSGIEAERIEVEVDVSERGLPKTILVGLPETAVRESAHRVERALVNSGFTRPGGRVVINLAPAGFPKNAPTLDLPLSLGVLAASGQLPPDRLGTYAAVGELALDGRARPLQGALAIARSAATVGALAGLLVPAENAAEAAMVDTLDIIPVRSLSEAVGFLADTLAIEPSRAPSTDSMNAIPGATEDFEDVQGQEQAKRALTILAGGRHHLLMVGPPGSGKTMMARRVPTIMPPLTLSEAIETTTIYSARGLLRSETPFRWRRPFRSPHHTVTSAGLIGGGTIPAAGEISLAHHGVLFLDELPEFQRRTLEALRQPLEEGQVIISRAQRTTRFPTEIILIGALNPCPCGYHNDVQRTCTCSPPTIERYLRKLSGPLLDRFDLHLEVAALPLAACLGTAKTTSSLEMRSQVERAHRIQAARFEGSRTQYNSQMTPAEIGKHCQLSASTARLLTSTLSNWGLSARAHHKIRRVARTIADLEGTPHVEEPHLCEAVTYRVLDRQQHF